MENGKRMKEDIAAMAGEGGSCRYRPRCSGPRPRRLRRIVTFACCAALIFSTAAVAQVSPAEILNLQLKASEEAYLHQLQALNLDIQSIKFPFPFHLARYVNLDPKEQIAMDTRGVEFVKFHDRIVLKTTGIYSAAFNAERVTQNERASRVFQDVIVPVLKILPADIPADVACDAIGFEISYHVRSRQGNYDYEGKEILVAVLDKDDALAYSKLAREAQQQEVLNRSDIYLNGKPFGLALGEREAYDVEGLERSTVHKAAAAAAAPAESAKPNSEVRALRADPELLLGPSGARPTAATSEPPLMRSGGAQPTPATPEPPLVRSGGARPTAATPEPAPQSAAVPTSPVKPESQPPAGSARTQADADRLQAQFQTQLDALAKQGAAQFHFVDYAPPSLVVFHGKIFLQLTMRNPFGFEKESASIYKRSAQSFDLFLAQQLKSLLEKIPTGAEVEGLDITVLNQLASKPKPSSEAVEFICPLKPLGQFVEAEITNQDLINQSVVLVNGVRISLDLQRVE